MGSAFKSRILGTPADRARDNVQIQAGMNIRQFNQEITPAGNPAIPGLAKYQAAQATEQALAEGLMGTLSEDQTSLNNLKSDIMAGIMLNEMNLANVSRRGVATKRWRSEY